MARKQTIKRERFLPHEYARFGLGLSVLRVAVDNQTVRTVDEERHFVDVSNLQVGTLSLEVSVSVPPDVADRAGALLSVIVVSRNAKTRFRRATTLSARDGGDFVGALQFQRDDVFGSVEVIPFALGEGGIRLASSRSWEVRFDRLREAPGGFLDIRYESFSEAGAPQFPQPKSLFQLEAHSEHPILWLNQDFQDVQGILESKGHTGWRARARDVVFDQIEHAVTVELFLRAAESCRDVEEAPYDWQASILARYLVPLFPEEADHLSRIRALQEAMSDGQLAEVCSRLSSHLQVTSKLGDHVARLAQEASE